MLPAWNVRLAWCATGLPVASKSSEMNWRPSKIAGDGRTIRKPPYRNRLITGLSAPTLARVRWELDILKRWQRDPNFYIEQTLTPVGEALTIPGPYDEKHSQEILARLNSIPAILEEAKKNLSAPPAPFAKMAIDSLAGIRPKLEQLARTLAPETTIPAAEWRACSTQEI